MVRFALCLAVVATMAASMPLSALVLVRDGKPASVIVTANNPAPVPRKAAEELQHHLERMSGARLPIIEEKDLRPGNPALILVGQSELLKSLGIDTTQLPPETMIVRTARNVLVLAGDDRGPRREDFDSSDVNSGTLYAVYDFLQDELGCRWVWPGPTGEVVPKRSTIEVGDLAVQETPKLFMRHFRSGMQWVGQFAEENFPRYMDEVIGTYYQPMVDDERLWMKRMRMGRSDKPQYGHAFTQWYDRYHDTHPEIFAMQEDGHRGIASASYPKDFVKMCPSSDELVDLLIEEFKAQRARNPQHRWLNACENDGSQGFCQCAQCKALDVELTDEVRSQLTARGWSEDDIQAQYGDRGDGLPRSLSNRYFHFYNKLARRLAEVAPDAYVVVYAYSRYRFAPLNMQLEPNILVGLIGFNNYPMTEAVHLREMRNFEAWKSSGIEKLFFRPNSFFFSPPHGIPWDGSTTIGGDFKTLADNGIVATDFDILNGHWSTTAPTYYVVAREHWDSDQDAQSLRREWMETFGPAADAVDRYFAFWGKVFDEAQTRPDLDEVAKRGDPYGGEIGVRKAIPFLLSEEDFQHGAELLAEARAAAEPTGDADLLQRLEVLDLGLEHGRLLREAAKFAVERDPAKPLWYEEHWPLVVQIQQIREQLAKLRAHNVYWLDYFGIRMHDMYATRVYYDFANRPFEPVYEPAEDDWAFVPDPEGVGERENWQAKDLKQPKLLNRNNRYQHLFFSTWDSPPPARAWKRKTGNDQMVNGWYSINFAIPEKAVASDSVLFVPYIRGAAKIWIDGKLVREVSPAEGAGHDAVTIPLSKASIEAGKPFRLTIKVHSPNEAGGLTGPVYVARPASR